MAAIRMVCDLLGLEQFTVPRTFAADKVNEVSSLVGQRCFELAGLAPTTVLLVRSRGLRQNGDLDSKHARFWKYAVTWSKHGIEYS